VSLLQLARKLDGVENKEDWEMSIEEKNEVWAEVGWRIGSLRSDMGNEIDSIIGRLPQSERDTLKIVLGQLKFHGVAWSLSCIRKYREELEASSPSE
jgi:hypothetical protein